MLLTSVLTRDGFIRFHAQGEADVLITKTALAKASGTRTNVVGNNTDLLVLLLSPARN